MAVQNSCNVLSSILEPAEYAKSSEQNQVNFHAYKKET
jgi:hypothetical protein